MNMQPKTKKIPKKNTQKMQNNLVNETVSTVENESYQIIELLKQILEEVKKLKKQYISSEEIFVGK